MIAYGSTAGSNAPTVTDVHTTRKTGACKDYLSWGTFLFPRNSDVDQQLNAHVHANLRSEKSRLRDIEMKQTVVFGSPNLDSFFITRCSHLSKPEVAKLLPMPPICSPHPVSVWPINGELFSYFKKMVGKILKEAWNLMTWENCMKSKFCHP